MFGKKKRNSKKGIFTCYWKNGNPRLMLTFKGKEIDGPLKIFYETGEVMFEGIAERGNTEVKLTKFRKFGEEIKTTRWTVCDLSDVFELSEIIAS